MNDINAGRGYSSAEERYPSEHSEARPRVTEEDVHMGRATVNAYRESQGYDKVQAAVAQSVETPWNIMGEDLMKLDENIARLGQRIGFILRSIEETSDPQAKDPGGRTDSPLQQEMWSRVEWIRRINDGVESLIRRVDL